MSRVLLDSNIVIYSLASVDSIAAAFIARHRVCVSAITRVETLGFTRIMPAEIEDLSRFFSACTVLPIDDPVIDRSIALRQQRKIKLGDSIVAATALAHGVTLATRNTRDFAWVPGLRLIDPYSNA